jgi:hypothetical protein
MTNDGEEVMLTTDEQERARDAHALMIEAYEDAAAERGYENMRADYYGV